MAEVDDHQPRWSVRARVDRKKRVELAVHPAQLRGVNAARGLIVRESAEQLRFARIRKVVHGDRARTWLRRDHEETAVVAHGDVTRRDGAADDD